jgi:uncharacterized protein (DUF849 family)
MSHRGDTSAGAILGHAVTGREGLISPPFIHQFVMGYQIAIVSTAENVTRMTSELPKDSVYFVAGIGLYQRAVTTLGIPLGGRVRLGREDSLYYVHGRKMSSNAEAVERVVRIARRLNRAVAPPAQARELIGVPGDTSSVRLRRRESHDESRRCARAYVPEECCACGFSKGIAHDDE